MSKSDAARHKTALVALAGLIILWGALGVLDVGNVPYSGLFPCFL